MSHGPERTGVSPASAHYAAASEGDFKEKVLQHLKMHHPHEDLASLLSQLKTLSPGNSGITLAALSAALNHASATLHQDASQAEYARRVLDRYAAQLSGVNAFLTAMMYERFFPSDDSGSKPELW